MVALCLLIASCDQVYGLTGRTDDARLDDAAGDGADASSCPVPLVLDPATSQPISAFNGTQSAPSLSATKLELYFVDTGAGPDIFRATRASTIAPWSAGAPLAFNSAFDDAEPSITADGLHLFFASNRETMSAYRAVYEARRSGPGAEWTEIHKVEPITFSVGSLDISADGKTLYVVEMGGTTGLYKLERGNTDDDFATSPTMIGLGTTFPSVDAAQQLLYWSDSEGIRRATRNGNVFIGADVFLAEGVEPDLVHDGTVLTFRRKSGGLAFLEASCPGL